MASLEEPGELKKSARTFQVAATQVRFLGEFPGGAHHEVLAFHVQQAGRDLPEIHADRVPVLLEQQDFAVARSSAGPPLHRGGRCSRGPGRHRLR